MAAVSNFRVHNYITDGAVLTWDIQPALVNSVQLFSADDSSPISWSLIATLSPRNDTFVVNAAVIPIDHDWFKLYVDLKDGSTTELLLQVNVHGSVGTNVYSIATDLNGVPRRLKVDEGGNLVVTAVTLNSPGTSDASASLQNQQITLANAANSKLDAIDASISAVISKLGMVSLTSGNITDLRNVTVSNFPGEFPDSVVRAGVSDIANRVATELTLQGISTKINPLLKASDLALAAGVLSTDVTNFPSDFPDSASATKLDQSLSQLIANGVMLGHIRDELVVLQTDVNDVESNVINVESAVTSLEAFVGTNVVPEIATCGGILSTIEASVATEATLSSIETLTGTLLKSSDLLFTGANELVSFVSNMPTDFPDAVAQQKTEEVKLAVQALDLHDVQLSASIPSGTNAIGSVTVTSLPLPPGASTEATLSSVLAKATEINLEIARSTSGSVKKALADILATVTAIDLKLVQDTNTLKYSHTFENIPAKGVVSTGIVDTRNTSFVQLSIICGSAVGCTARIDASMDGINFYPMKGMTLLSIPGEVFHTLTLDLILPYIKLSLTNPSSTSQISSVSVEVRGKK